MTSNYKKLVASQREYFLTGATLSLEARQQTLLRLGEAVKKHATMLVNALRADLGKSEGEILMLELGPVMDGLQHSLEHLPAWMRAEELPSPPALQPGLSRVRHEPLGVALIMAPWNYPFQLSFLPLIAALSAGNCVVLKPSSQTPRTVEAMCKCLEVFPEEQVALVRASGRESDSLLQERFDAILYTGSARVGRQVMRAAARHLTPVCLELGGKSPAMVTKDTDLPLAARRIAWGKQLNAGQTCIAPDYVLADASVRDELIDLLQAEFSAMLGLDPLGNPEYARIISNTAFDRLVAMAPPEVRLDRAARKIAPLAFAADQNHPCMKEEIFGPLLPVLSFNTPEEAFSFIRNGEKPLAFYIFTADDKLAELALEKVSSGGACVNDVLLHAASAEMPFGGVGASGMGRYHGRYGFTFFSHVRGVLLQSTTADLALRYPPYTEEKMAILRSMGG